MGEVAPPRAANRKSGMILRMRPTVAPIPRPCNGGPGQGPSGCRKPGPRDAVHVGLQEAMEVDYHIFHLGIIDSALGLAAPRLLGRGIAVVDAHQINRVHVEVEAARILYPPAKYQVKLAHGASRYCIVRP